MTVSPHKLSLFVKIECDAYTSHRDPQGVYSVEVQKDKTLTHAACAAIQLVKDHVAFLDENSDKATLRVFRDDGQEVLIPMSLNSDFHNHGSFRGRALDYPDIICLQ